MTQRRCQYCGCKLIYYGKRIDRSSTKWVHVASLAVCQRLREAKRLLTLYRIKFALSDVDGWDASGHLIAKDALTEAGEPRITFFEAQRLARKVRP